MKDAHSEEFQLQILTWSRKWCASMGEGASWTIMQLLAKVDWEYTCLKNLGQWKSNDPDSQVIALQAKVDTLTRTISHFRKQPPPKPRPREPTKPSVPSEKNKNDDHPSWTPKDDSKQIVMYKGAK